MTKKFRWLICIIGLMVLITPLSSAFAGPKAPRVKVMTRNLYLGADIFRIAEATKPEDIPAVVAEVYKTMLYTNFWARAEAIADEIMDADADVIGLQEVATFYKQTPKPPRVYAETTEIDFYKILNDALEALGLYYKAYPTTNSDVELPMLDPTSTTGLSYVRMVDHDVILVKDNYKSQMKDQGNYYFNLKLKIAGKDIEFTRGYGIVKVVVKGTPFLFVNTHLEVSGEEGSPFRWFQSMQMMELAGRLALCRNYPIILVGDFNSSPEDKWGFADVPGVGNNLPYVPPYRWVTGPKKYKKIFYKKFSDTWLLQKKPNKPIYDEGYTFGFEEKIDYPDDTLETRIDHIFLYTGTKNLKKTQNEVVGNDPTDMVENLPGYPNEYLWPSDHAGVTSKIHF